MKRELKRIEPKSVLRVAFFLGLVCGFLFGLYSGWVLQELSGTLLTAEESAALGGVAGGSIFVSGIVMALTGALFFSLGGGALAGLYNFLAGRFGGIEYETEDDEPQAAEPVRDLTDYTSD